MATEQVTAGQEAYERYRQILGKNADWLGLSQHARVAWQCVAETIVKRFALPSHYGDVNGTARRFSEDDERRERQMKTFVEKVKKSHKNINRKDSKHADAITS